MRKQSFDQLEDSAVPVEIDGIFRFFTYLFILVFVFLTVFPLYWMVTAATLPMDEFFSYPPRLIPGTQLIENFQATQESIDIVRALFNSTFIATTYTLVSALICSMAGFAFAKYDFPFKLPLFLFVLALLMLPLQLMVIPLFLLMQQLGWLNTYWAVIVPWLANPIGIFLMRQSMKSVPDALLDSARMDGASEFQVFYRVALPTVRSSVVALGIILFLGNWNAFLWPLIVLQEEKMFTLPLALNQLVSSNRIEYDELMVATIVSVIPIIIMLLVMQRYFVKGIVQGAVKE
jgi:lactose/L-arabinose transport system permease protein